MFLLPFSEPSTVHGSCHSLVKTGFSQGGNFINRHLMKKLDTSSEDVEEALGRDGRQGILVNNYEAGEIACG